MTRRSKFFLFLPAFVLLLLVLAGVAVHRHASSNNYYIERISEFIEQETGYRIETSGAVSLSLLPKPALKIGGINLSNPVVQTGRHIASATGVRASVRWLPLFTLNGVVDLDLESLTVNLVVDAQGEANWLPVSQPESDRDNSIVLDRVNISSTDFNFRNLQSSEELEFELGQFQFDLALGRTDLAIDTAAQIGQFGILASGDIGYDTVSRELELALEIGIGPSRGELVEMLAGPTIGERIETEKGLLPLVGHVIGNVALQDGLPQGELQFDFELDQWERLALIAGPVQYINPSVGTLEGSGKIRIKGSDFDIVSLEAGLEEGGNVLNLTGSVMNLLSTLEARFQASAAVNELPDAIVVEKFERLDGEYLRDIGPVAVSTQIGWINGKTDFSNIDLEFAGQGFSTSTSGNAEIHDSGIGYVLDVLGTLDDINDVMDWSDTAEWIVGLTGPVSGNARISGNQDSLRIENAAISTGDALVESVSNGVISWEDGDIRFDLDSSVNLATLTVLSPELQGGGYPLPEESNGQATARISGSQEAFDITELELQLNDPVQQLQLTGSLLNLPEEVKYDLKFQYDTEGDFDLGQLSDKMEVMMVDGPLDVSGELQNQGETISFTDLTMFAGETDLRGKGAIDFGATPIRYEADLVSSRFLTDVLKVVPSQDSEQQDPYEQVETMEGDLPTEKEAKALYKEYTESIPIRTDWIKNLDVEFRFAANMARGADIEFEDLNLDVEIRDGVFKITDYSAKIRGKPVSFDGLIDTNQDPPHFEYKGQVAGRNLEDLLNVEHGLLEGGEIAGEFDVASAGTNLNELIGNLNGQGLMTMGPLKIRSNALSLVSSDLLVTVLQGMVRSRDDDPVSKYNCGVLGVEIENGVATINRSFTMEARDYNLGGRGEIDLNTGHVDIVAFPKARRGLGLSLSSAVGGFSISGNLATPNFGMRGGGLLTTAMTGYFLAPTLAASSTAAAASNPATAAIVATGIVAKGFFDRLTASNYTCANTLRRIERRRAAAEGELQHTSGKTHHNPPR